MTQVVPLKPARIEPCPPESIVRAQKLRRVVGDSLATARSGDCRPETRDRSPTQRQGGRNERHQEAERKNPEEYEHDPDDYGRAGLCCKQREPV